MNTSLKIAAPLAIALALAACSDADTDATELDTATTDGEVELLEDAIGASDFDELELGAKIVGPQGPEVKVALSNDAGNFADMTSYVACPVGLDPCDPKTAPDGTIYTYVHTVYPGEDNDASTGSGEGADSSDIEQATLFRMTQPAHGFTGNAGYSKLEAVGAVGEKVEVAITCEDGALAWTISAGDGGNQWEQAEPLTFYWQSTLPPAGPSRVYEVSANYTTASGDGPYPAASDTATNACLAGGAAQGS